MDTTSETTLLTAAISKLERSKPSTDSRKVPVIDAQLELLRWALETYKLPNRSHPIPLETRVRALAQALLNDDEAVSA